MKIPHVTRLSTTTRMLTSPHWKLAKQGSSDAARLLISDILCNPTKPYPCRGWVCPVQKPAGNRIPQALAHHLVLNAPLTLCSSVMLTHTPHGSSMVDRLYYQPQFSGTVMPGNYTIVDDVYTTGRTLKALKDFIEANGGNVVAAICLGGGPSLQFEPSRIMLQMLTARFPDITLYFDLYTLTVPQVHYLLRLSSLKTLFNRRYQQELKLLFG